MLGALNNYMNIKNKQALNYENIDCACSEWVGGEGGGCELVSWC